MTKKRQAIFSLIQEATQPLNAGQIFESVKREMDLTTVYRGLQYLEDEKYISSFVFSCDSRGVERYYALANSTHAHYMHCRRCHSFFLLPGCPLGEAFKEKTEVDGFLVEGHTVTLKGLCKSCL